MRDFLSSPILLKVFQSFGDFALNFPAFKDSCHKDSPFFVPRSLFRNPYSDFGHLAICLT